MTPDTAAGAIGQLVDRGLVLMHPEAYAAALGEAYRPATPEERAGSPGLHGFWMGAAVHEPRRVAPIASAMLDAHGRHPYVPAGWADATGGRRG